MNLKEVEVALADFKHLLSIEEATDCFYIKMPYVYGEKGRETWRQVNEAVKECGGKWVSMGKDSHWEIPYVGAPPPRTANDEIRHEAMKLIAACRETISKLENLTK